MWNAIFTEAKYWQDPSDYRALQAVNNATQDIPNKYEVGPGRLDQPILTPTWRAAAQLGLLTWIQESDATEEALRRTLMTIDREGHNHNLTLDDLGQVVNNNMVTNLPKPAYQRLLAAYEQHSADMLGNRQFGDAQTVVDRQRSLSLQTTPSDYAWEMAWSNGCPNPIAYLDKIKGQNLDIPAIKYISSVTPELTSLIDQLDGNYHLQLHIWDNARHNKLWTTLMARFANNGNQTLYQDIMAQREYLSTSDESEFQSLPRPVLGRRQLRFLALTDSYDIVKKIWDDFDQTLDKSGDEQAKAEFGVNIARVSTRAKQVRTLAELKTAFLRK